MTRPLAAALALALLAACGGNPQSAPWLTNATPATHTKFAIADGPHASPAAAKCDDCHGLFDTFRQFTCTGCHTQAKTDPLHAAVAGYLWDSPSCYRCHPNGRATSVNHATKFPIGPGTKHAAVACSDCHLVPIDRKQVGCIACHTGNHAQATAAGQHVNVSASSYGYSDPLCLRCHADGPLTIAGHTPFTISPGGRHPTDCFQCHPQFRADKTWGADFGQPALNCYTAACHVHDAAKVAQTHQGRPNFVAGSSSACAGCHPTGQQGGN